MQNYLIRIQKLVIKYIINLLYVPKWAPDKTNTIILILSGRESIGSGDI